MLAMLSPAKKLTPTLAADLPHTLPALQEELGQLLEIARTKSAAQLRSLMHISEALGQLNFERFQHFEVPFTRENATHAALTFAGDTYVGLDAGTFEARDFTFAQDHVAILSGLYGVLRPLDLMQPYRLEMGTALKVGRHANLYGFWQPKLAPLINQLTEGHADRTVINCASKEYSKAVVFSALAGPVITPHFKEAKDGKLKSISFYAKRARGMMARYLVDSRAESPEALKDFDYGGYVFDAAQSTDSDWLFTRPQPIPKSAKR